MPGDHGQSSSGMGQVVAGLMLALAVGLVAVALPVGWAIRATWKPEHTLIIVIFVGLAGLIAAATFAAVVAMAFHRWIWIPWLAAKKQGTPHPDDPLAVEFRRAQIEDVNTRTEVRRRTLTQEGAPPLLPPPDAPRWHGLPVNGTGPRSLPDDGR